MAVFIPTLLLSVGLLCLPNSAEALVRISDPIVSLDPATPPPYSEATIKINDPNNLPIGSTVRWFVDNVEQTNHENRPQINFVTKKIDDPTEIEVLITSPQTGLQRVSVIISPIRVDLIVNANSHVPGFYKGRALPSGNSEISVRALVFGDNTEPYSYHWRVNGQNVSNNVGNTNSHIVFKPGLDSQMYVELEIYNRANELVARKSLTIPLSEPEIHFYEANPLRGLIPNVLPSAYYLLNQEVILRGEPYYFTGSLNALDTDWKIDRRSYEPSRNPLELSLVKTQETGSATIELRIINTDGFSEVANKEIKINY